MGKVKKVVMDASQEAVVKAKAVTRKKSMIIWEDLYPDLTPHVAEALRLARVKPDQLTTMADGDLTAIQGINDTALEEIRAKYTLDLSTPTPNNSAPLKVSSTEDVTDSQTETPTSAGERDSHKDSTPPANKRHDFRHGKAIQIAKSKVDHTKTYGLEDAIKLVKTTNITKFDATLTLHLNLSQKLSRVEVTFPFVAGTSKRVAIADDQLLADVEKGKIEFDILLATPAMMPKLAKLARVLGPKGLMPSPKSGTITPDPEAKKQEFEGGKTVVKAESKFPLMHVTIGKLSQKNEELIANIQALLLAVKPKNITKAVLAGTMSPGVKIAFS